MEAMSPPPLHERYTAGLTRPALSPVSPDDHAGQVWILAILATIYTGTSLVVRGSIKWNLFWVDDYLLAIATAIHFAQAGAVFYGLNHGLAKLNSITTESQWATAGRAFFTSEILAVVALCLAKCSVWALLLRIFIADGAFNDWRVKTCLGFVMLGAAWGVLAVVSIALRCDAASMMIFDRMSQCEGQVTRWQTVTTLDIATEALGCLLPIALVWSLNMSIKSKSQVFLAFSFRSPLIILSMLHIKYMRDYAQATEPLFAATNPLLCQQAMLTWSLISATIPNVKGFMKVFSFSMGMGALDERSSYQTPDRIAMHTLRGRTATNEHGGGSGNNNSSSSSNNNNNNPVLRADLAQHIITIASSGRATADDDYSMKRNDSQEMIIKKEVQIRVSHENRGDDR